MKLATVGNILLAIGSGLGVWLITHMADAGVVDFAIVLFLIVIGSIMKGDDKTTKS